MTRGAPRARCDAKKARHSRATEKVERWPAVSAAPTQLIRSARAPRTPPKTHRTVWNRSMPACSLVSAALEKREQVSRKREQLRDRLPGAAQPAARRKCLRKLTIRPTNASGRPLQSHWGHTFPPPHRSHRKAPVWEAVQSTIRTSLCSKLLSARCRPSCSLAAET